MKKLLLIIIIIFGIKSYGQLLNIEKNDVTTGPTKLEKGILPLLGAENNNSDQTNINEAPKSNTIGETPGNLSVSLTGAANYNIPIETPPGINGVQPQISLMYNSQGGNGIAGYGWNLKGISKITRVPSTKFHNGNKKNVNLSNTDQYELDGKRLILKSGTHHTAGAVYETENYSNIEIKAHSSRSDGVSGPGYFVVKYPNGSKAYYGRTSDSRGVVDYSISYWENPQGLRVTYEYFISLNKQHIKKIKYGNKGANQSLNEIEFQYNFSSIIRNEEISLNGKNIISRYRLNNIEVFGNGTRIKVYKLEHDRTSLNYERLTKLTEWNGDISKRKNYVYFSYDNTSSNITYEASTTNLGLQNIEQRNANAFPIDFMGDGDMDLIVFPKNRSDLWIFKNLSSGYQNFPVSIPLNYESIFPSSYLNHSGKKMPGQGLTLVNSQFNQKEVDFTTYSGASAVSPLIFQYKKTWDAPTYRNYITATFFRERKIPMEYLSGDFNGDGLTDVIAIGKPYSSTYCWEYECNGGPGGDGPILEPFEEPINSDSINPTQIKNNQVSIKLEEKSVLDKKSTISSNDDLINSNICFNCNTSTLNYRGTYFIDLKNDNSSTFSKFSGNIQQSISNGDILNTGDFDGDGKTDILHITNGKLFVYSFDENNSIYLNWSITRSTINPNNRTLLGDYNGDGKTDFLHSRGDNTFSFDSYVSTGNYFSIKTKTQPFQYRLTNYDGDGTLVGYNLVPLDINGDGKTDIIDYITTTFNSNTNGSQVFKVYNNVGNSSQSQLGDFGKVTFAWGGSTTKTGDLKHFPIPIFLDSNKPNKDLGFASISNKWITKFNFTKDHREEMLLKQVQNNGVITEINYNTLDPDELTSDFRQFYQPSYDQTYPYVNSHTLKSTKVVTSLERRSGGNSDIESTFKYFGYQNAVSHFEGLGFIGFEGIAISNWHKDASDRIYTVSKFDHSLRGAKVVEWSDYFSYTFNFNSSSFITKKQNYYSSSISNDKVFKLQLDSSVMVNNVNGTNMTVNYEYDSYNNIEQLEKLSANGSQTQLFEYENSFGAENYIGKLKKVSTNSIIGGDSFSSEKEFIYDENLVTEKKLKGNNTPTNKENYVYDEYGNVIKKILTPHNTPARQIEFEYDNSGRFINKIIDVEGLETTYNFNQTNGVLISETNAFGQVKSYEYNDWLDPTKITDYLGNSVYIEYAQDNYYKTVTTTSDEGGLEIIKYDPYHRLIETSEKNVVGDLIKVRYQYNNLDQLIAQSEPFESDNPNQWTEIEYDIHGRTQKSTLPTGKVYNVLYNGLTVTVDDGNKEVSKTVDDLGNTLSITDPGGTISYNYYGNGNLKSTSFNGSTVSITQDGWGRKTELNDPSAGIFTYDYNGFGEIVEEVTPNGQTDWTYSNLGKLERKVVSGNNTDMTLDYTYDSTHKFLTRLSVTDNFGSRSSTYEYNYDNETRLEEVIETNGYAKFSKNYTYDSYGRIETEDYYAELFYNGKSTSKKIINSYQNGVLNSIHDHDSNNLIWGLNDVNARSQLTSASMGNSVIDEREYDQFGFIEEKEIRGGTTSSMLMKLTTDFNIETGVLNSRQNSMFSWSETFEYDDLERLIEYNDNVNTGINTYDDAGRIELNNSIGTYNYTGNSYKVNSIDLNAQGDLYYQRNNLQKIKYNAFQKPVSIDDKDNEKIDFYYNPFQKRSHMFYGNYEDQTRMRSKRKHYSFDGSMEIKYDFDDEETEFTFYIGGDGYDSPAIWRSKQVDSSVEEDFFYLHRDHLGSIMLITDGDGHVKEKRHFDAWGNIVRVFGENNNEIRQLTFLDRGYTGHEHLNGVNLIHMNARLYDPNLKRFLSPDNYIQDLTNTQNFDRYGYVLNNPLKYVDPSGNNYQNGEGGFNNGSQTWLGALFSSIIKSTEEPGGGWFGNYLREYGSVLAEIPNFYNNVADDIGRFFDKNVIKPIEKLFNNKPEPYDIRNPINLNSDPMAGSSITTSTSYFGSSGNTSGNLGILQGYDITTEDVVDTALDFVPIAGGVKDIYRGFENGDGWQVALGAGIIVLDVFTLGTASLAKGSIKTGFKLGSKAVTKYGARAGAQSFKSFSSFKRALGPAGPGNAWHHIVEQGGSNVSKFGASRIHNTSNLMKLPHGKGSIHAKISGFYSSKQPFTGGQTVRQWLSTQSYEQQYEFGIKTLKQFGWTP